MYLRKNTRIYKGKTYTNYLLVESIHTPKGPRQKVVCSLGDLSPRPRAQWLKLAHKVESALAGQPSLLAEQDPELKKIVDKVRKRQPQAPWRKVPEESREADDLVRVHTERVTTEGHREAGPVHVGYQFWVRLGLEEILAGIGMSERVRKLSCAMVMNRLIYPCSEHAMAGWIRRSALEDILREPWTQLAEDSLYRNLDRLYPNRATVESALVEKERSLFNLDQTVFLYDLTSTYFEGQALSNPKARRGYSRDRRPDCKQVVVGLVVNRDGFPIAHEIFEGNTQDRETLGQILDLLEKRVGFKEGQTVVVDRGMAYEENLEEIRSRKLCYLVASRQSERDRWLADFEEEGGFAEVLRSRSLRQKKSTVRVKRKRLGGETYVLCISSDRTEKDRAIREKQEQRLLVDLARLEKRIREGRLVRERAIGEAIGRLKERYPRVARYYRMNYDAQSKRFVYEVDEDKRVKAEKLDGSYLLKTDREDFSAEEAWRIYMLLTRAEAAFQAMKTPLAERPIFHQLGRRVETHIFLCVLAYHLLVAIEKTMLDKGIHTSWGTVREKLKTHQICTVVLPTDQGAVLRIRKASTPEPEHGELYNLLGVPAEIIHPKKIWSEFGSAYSD